MDETRKKVWLCPHCYHNESKIVRNDKDRFGQRRVLALCKRCKKIFRMKEGCSVWYDKEVSVVFE